MSKYANQQFKHVPIGAFFLCNSTLYKKRSTRTAMNVTVGKTFYFKQIEIVEVK